MFPRYMMATTAIHQLGDISSEFPDLCVVHSEDEENYIGNWVTGLGFVNVKFPKSTTQELTDEDIKQYDGMKLAMYGCHTGKHSYDCGTLNLKK